MLVGPTGAGKTRVAHALARARDLPVLSADSMSVYRGMDLGTAKPSRAERAEVRYLGLDLAEPHQPFSAGLYLERVAEELAGLDLGDTPLIVAGGTGLYIRALIHGLDAPPPADPAERARWEAVLASQGVAGLQEALRACSPERYAALADPANPRRLIRALETAGQQPVAEPGHSRAEGPTVAGLAMPRSAQNAALETRAAAMFAAGLVEEARAIRARAGFSPTAAQAIGYAEALALLDGALSLPGAVERTAVRTRQLAKRQMTWFRNQLQVEWIEVNPADGWGTIEGCVETIWNKYGPTTLCL